MIYDILWRYTVDSEKINIDSCIDCYISPLADRMLGLSKGNIQNSFQRYLSYVHPEDLPSLQEMLSQVIMRPGEEMTTKYRLQKADNTTLWVRSS